MSSDFVKDSVTVTLTHSKMATVVSVCTKRIKQKGSLILQGSYYALHGDLLLQM